MYDHKKKVFNVKQMNNYMLSKTLSMFEYQGLPDSIPAFELEKIIQSKGSAFIMEHEGVLYAFDGNLSGEVDVYGNFQKVIVTNSFLNIAKSFDIKTDGVLIRNDDMFMGLIPLFDKHNTMLAENDINMVMWGYNSRNQKIITAPDDKSKESAEQYIKKTVDGELAVIGDNATLFEGVKVHAAGSGQSNSIKPMLEYNQYIKASLFNEVGLSANFNMKKERLISSELDQSEDSLFPLVYNMMQCRLNAIKLINEKYGLNITVDFGSVWHFKNKKLVDGIIDTDILPDAVEQSKDGGELNEDEQRDEKPDNNVVSENVGELVDDEIEAETLALSLDTNLNELEDIINNPNSSDDDIQAAKDLIEELKGGKDE